jgi:hypothetical protein
MTERISNYIRDLRENGAPVYYSTSTNALGGIVFGLVSGYFNPKVPMPQTLPYMIMRVLFGAGAGIAFSLGAFCFTMPYTEKLADSINKHIKNEVGRDLIYSFLSIGVSLAVLIGFAYFLFSLYRGRIPVDHKTLIFPWFISSIVLTDWIEIASIPLSGTVLKGLLRAFRKILAAL